MLGVGLRAAQTVQDFGTWAQSSSRVALGRLSWGNKNSVEKSSTGSSRGLCTTLTVWSLWEPARSLIGEYGLGFRV